MGEVKLTVSIPNGEDPGAGRLPDTSHMEDSGLLPDSLKPHAKFKFAGPHEAELTLTEDNGAAYAFAQKFKLAKEGYLYDFDDNPYNGEKEFVIDTRLTQKQIDDIAAGLRAYKGAGPLDPNKFFSDRGMTGRQMSLLKASGVYERSLRDVHTTANLADNLPREYAKLKEPLKIRYFDQDDNPDTLQDLYWLPETTFNTHAEKLAALAAPTGGTKLAEEAKPEADLSKLLKPVTQDMITRYGDFIYHALLVPAGAPSGTSAQMVALKDDLVKNNFAEFAKGVAGRRITVDKTEYRLPNATEISAYKLAHLGSNTVNNAVHHIGDENIRSIRVGSINIPVLVLHKSGGQCSTEKQSSFSANYNTGEFVTLDFFVPFDAESDFFKLVNAAPQAACMIDHTTADGKNMRKFRLSRVNVGDLGDSIVVIGKALELKKNGKVPVTLAGTVPTADQLKLQRAYEIFSELTTEDVAKLLAALAGTKEKLGKMISQGENPPERGAGGGDPLSGWTGVLILAAIFLFSPVGSTVVNRLIERTKRGAQLAAESEIGISEARRKVYEKMGAKEFLENYADNLVDKAIRQIQDGTLKPVIGREEAIKKVFDIWSQEGKTTAALTGESGVGKSYVAWGVAIEIAKARLGQPSLCPPGLKDIAFYELDMSRFVGGTKYRGELEDRLTVLKRIAKENPLLRKIFIDEGADNMRAGQTEGSPGVLTSLKAAISKGEFGGLLALTDEDYLRTIATDDQLKRRFPDILIKELPKDIILSILQKVTGYQLDLLRGKIYPGSKLALNIAPDAYDYLMDNAKAYFNRANPDASQDALLRLMTTIYRQAMEGNLANVVTNPDGTQEFEVTRDFMEHFMKTELTNPEFDKLESQITVALRELINIHRISTWDLGIKVASLYRTPDEEQGTWLRRVRRMLGALNNLRRTLINPALTEADFARAVLETKMVFENHGRDASMDLEPATGTPEPKDAAAEAPDAPSPIRGKDKKPRGAVGQVRTGQTRRSAPTRTAAPVGANPSVRPPVPTSAPAASPSPMPTDYAGLIKALGMEEMVKRVRRGKLAGLLALNVMGHVASDGRYADLGTELWILREWLEASHDPLADQKVREFSDGFCGSEGGLDVRGFVEEVLARDRVEDKRKHELRDMVAKAEERVKREVAEKKAKKNRRK